MRKRTIRNLFRRRLPTRPLNSAAGDGKHHGPHVSCDPFGWDQWCASSVLPNRRSAGAGRGGASATAPVRFIHLLSRKTSKDGRDRSVVVWHPIISSTNAHPAEMRGCSQRAKVVHWCDRRKKDAKSKATTYTVILKLFAPSTSA